MSEGSAKHAAKDCKPCDFMHIHKGCSHDAACPPFAICETTPLTSKHHCAPLDIMRSSALLVSPLRVSIRSMGNEARLWAKFGFHVWKPHRFLIGTDFQVWKLSERVRMFWRYIRMHLSVFPNRRNLSQAYLDGVKVIGVAGASVCKENISPRTCGHN